MTTLARGISATTTILDVSDESLNVARPFLATLDSETVRVRGLEYVSGVATRWNVDRGIDSTPATHAGGASVTLGDGGPGGAAEAGTVVVTPPLEVDVAAALEGANAPDGANPLATLDDIATLGPVQVVTRTYSSAEILDLSLGSGNPPVLVAGEADNLIIPLWAILVMHPGATPYIENTQLAVGSNEMGEILTIDATDVLDAATPVLRIFASAADFAIPAGSGLWIDYPAAIGTPLVLFASGGNPTAGDGTLDLTVLYRTLDVS